MLRWLMRRKMAAFERDLGYDMSYGREILDAAGPWAFMRFARVRPLGTYRHDVPRDAWHAAKLAAFMVEDCGPCTQLAVVFAERAGVPRAVLAAVLRGDDAALSDDARLTVAFARSALARSLDADEHRDAVVARFGRRGLVSLAYAITTARLYPTLKYALGYGQACTRVNVGGEVVLPRLQAAAT